MSSSSPIGARWSILVVPLLVFGCFTAEKSGDDDDDDAPAGCRVDGDCRHGRVCLDLDGNRNDICEVGEECACGPPGSGSGGSSSGGSGGGDTGGNATGGNATGGNSTGGNATGGNSTGGNATGGSSTGGGASDCGAYCEKIVAAMCSTTITQATCLTGCNDTASGCTAETPPALTCVLDPAKPIMCQSGAPAINGCDSQLDAWNRCSVCLPETGDMACATCSKGSCCDEVGDWVLSAESQAFFDCATACTTQACFDGCETMYPAAAAANTALGECQDDSCPEECICAAGSNDTTCTTCAKGSCCAQYVDYLLAPDFVEFDTCAADCTDDPCFLACIDMYPTAGAAFDALSTCLNGSCATQCGGA